MSEGEGADSGWRLMAVYGVGVEGGWDLGFGADSSTHGEASMLITPRRHRPWPDESRGAVV